MMEENFFGNLIVNESEILRTQREKTKTESPEPTPVKPSFEPEKESKVHMFGTLRVRLRRIAEQMNDFQLMFKNPFIEFTVPTMPNYLNNFKNFIFITDESGNLSIVESNEELEIKSTQKLSIMNICGVAVNQNYIATSFGDLSKENIKAVVKQDKKLKKFDKKSGVMLFNWDETSFMIKYDKLIDLTKNDGFISPNGIVMNENHLYVCDKHLHGIYKFDIKTGELLQKLSLNDAEPISMSICDRLLIYIDSLKQEINIIDTEKFNRIKWAKISDEFQCGQNGFYDLVLKQNSLIYLKNRSDSKVVIYDFDLNVKNMFEYDCCNNQGITMLKTKNEFLIIGRNNDNKCFKLGFFNDI